MKTKKSEQLFVMLLSIGLIIILSVVFFNLRQNYLYTNRDRLIVFCYQTNITGSDGEEWAKELKKQFPHIPDFEVSSYEMKEAGNESITITSENGWAQIVTRLGAGEGDILFVDNKVFYEVLLKQDLLSPIQGNFEAPVTDKNGTIYGIDVTEMTVEGLVNHGTSQYVGLGQPLPIKPVDNGIFEHNGFKYSARVIAVIFKGSERIEQSQEILNTLFGDKL